MKKKPERTCFFSESMFSILLKMKLLSLFILVTLATASASTYSQATKFSMEFDNASVMDVFQYIENNSEFIILYNEKYFDVDRIVSVKAYEETVESILNQLFSGTDNTFKIYDRQVVILLQTEIATLKSASIVDEIQLFIEELEQPRTREITGRVLDTNGQALIGVSIIIKDTFTGTISDIEGRFRLAVPIATNVLVLSYVGMKTMEVDISDIVSVNIIMEEDLVGIEEVVVVGYGVQKKQSVVGAISQTTGTEILQSLRGSDLKTALRGSVPGLVTVINHGLPGGQGTDNPETAIYIRGKNTWNDSQPLILVDGIEREMNDVDPYTIEAISVLKDASATAVFGVKGANGVILITSKRGTIGHPRISLNVNTTAKTVSRIPPVLNSYDTYRIKNYVLLNEIPYNLSAWNYMVPNEWLEYYRDQTYPDYLPSVNWAQEMLKDFTWDKNVNLTISGGTRFVRYFGSLSYLNEGDVMKIQDFGQGYLPNFEYNRFNFRSNLDFDITPTTVFTVNLSGFVSAQKRPLNALENTAWYSLYNFPPGLIPPRYSDGTWAQYALDSRYENDLLDANFSGYRLNKSNSAFTDFQLVQKMDFITKGLSAKAKLSYDIRANTTGPNLGGGKPLAKYIQKDIMYEIWPGMSEAEIKALEDKYTIWVPGSSFEGTPVPPNPEFGSESASPNLYRQLNYELSLNYNRDFGKHTIGGLFLMARNERATGSIFPSYREDWVGRAVYNYDDRYLLELNAAYNGSEKFAKENRFGFFPSMAVGWIISNEPFFEIITPVVNNLKIRYSDGIVGSDAGIARWLYTGSFDVTNTRWYFGDPFYQQSTYPQRFEGVIPNALLKWETARKSDIGIEASFFQNLINVSFDYFWEDRTDIFVSGSQRVIPQYFGAPAVAGNFGRVKVEGWEVESDLMKTTPGGFTFRAGLAWAYARDEVIIGTDPELIPPHRSSVGLPMNQPRNYINVEIIDNWNDVYVGVLTQSNVQNTRPGFWRALDYDSNGRIFSDDAVPYSYPPRPQYTYSPKIGFEYKGFSLDLNFYGTYNLRTQVLGNSLQAFINQQDVLHEWALNSWSPELGNVGGKAKYMGLNYMVASFYGPNTLSRAALRLQNAILAYTLRSKLVQKIGISNMRFSLNGENLFLWSEMIRDQDDEATETSGYPVLKRVTFGLNINF